jgi:LacI family transcriptional regulator
MFIHSRDAASRVPPWFPGWRGDGVIARVESLDVARCLSRRRLPFIDVRGHFDLGTPIMDTDDAEVARLALEHFVGRGFRQLAFVGFRKVDYSERRRRYFTALTEAAGLPLHVYEAPTPARLVPSTLYEQHALRFSAKLRAWIRRLPRAVGILACNDICALQVLSACHETGRAVPEELAVLGVDDDAVFCDLAVPPLSSIALDTEKIGYLAAQWLEQMMDGTGTPPSRTLVAPLCVICRRSTDSIAVEDPDVAAALRFIREHAAERIRVHDVVGAVALSRRSLERRFQDLLGRSPHDEIIRERIRCAEHMLRDTDLPLRTIAHRAGFTHPEYLSAAFLRQTGQQPSEFRAAAQS